MAKSGRLSTREGFVQFVRIRLRPVMRPVVRQLLWFRYNTAFIDGDRRRVRIGHRVGLSNTLINTASGDIEIGDYSIFGYNVMLLTGRHNFAGGRRASLHDSATPRWGGGPEEVPLDGGDIRIGSGCWIASGSIVVGGVTIGDDCIVMSGSVVTKDVPSGSIVGGVPAALKGSVADL